MVPVDVRRQTHLSFTQLDQYLRCPLKYRFTYLDRVEPDFVPAALAFGSGIHGAAAFYYRAAAEGRAPSACDLQGWFETFWNLENQHRPLKFGEKETKETLLELAIRMLGTFHAAQEPRQVVAVERAFDVPLVDLDTGEVLDRGLVGSWDLLERDEAGRLVVVDLKTAGRRYTDLQVELSLQLSVYNYAAVMSGLADQEEVRLRFDVLTKTRQPELVRYWTERDRGACVRLFRMAGEVLRGIEAGVFWPNPGWQCRECQFRSRCWAWP